MQQTHMQRQLCSRAALRLAAAAAAASHGNLQQQLLLHFAWRALQAHTAEKRRQSVEALLSKLALQVSSQPPRVGAKRKPLSVTPCWRSDGKTKTGTVFSWFNECVAAAVAVDVYWVFRNQLSVTDLTAHKCTLHLLDEKPVATSQMCRIRHGYWHFTPLRPGASCRLTATNLKSPHAFTPTTSLISFFTCASGPIQDALPAQ